MLIAGIVVTGNGPKRLLVRAVGSGLSRFGVGGTLDDPVLTLLSGATVLRANDTWSSSGSGEVSFAELNAAFASVGAFSLSFSGTDAALLLTLQPGNYTAQISAKLVRPAWRSSRYTNFPTN